MSSAIKKLKLNSTPNSSKLAEILLQLKEDSQSSAAMAPQTILEEEHPPATAAAPAAPEDTQQELPTSSSSKKEAQPPSEEEQPHTLPASEACNCRKSKCLKLYCQCFASRAICGQFCRCLQCENRSANSVNRLAAIKSVLDRNPNAFESKYKTTAVAASAAANAAAGGLASTDVAPIAHKNGCRCRKSLCLKKYCECFQGGVHCSNICTCLVCYNRSGAPLVANRVNTLPTGEINAQSVLNQYAALANNAGNNSDLLTKRSLSESAILQPTDENALFNASFSLQALNPRLSLSSQSSNEDDRVSPPHAQRPPIGATSKRRKSSPLSESCLSVDLRTTPSSSAAALLSLNPALLNASNNSRPETTAPLVPGTPSTMVHLPLRVESTPYVIRSASPNSLSIAKALSLLGASATLAQALDLANSLELMNTPHHNDLLAGASRQSSNSKDSISTAGDTDSQLNSSLEMSDEHDLIVNVRKKLEYDEKLHYIATEVFPTSDSQ